MSEDLSRRLMRIAAVLDGPGSLPRVEPGLRGDPAVSAVITGGGAFLTLSGELARMSRELRTAAGDLRAIAADIKAMPATHDEG